MNKDVGAKVKTGKMLHDVVYSNHRSPFCHFTHAYPSPITLGENMTAEEEEHLKEALEEKKPESAGLLQGLKEQEVDTVEEPEPPIFVRPKSLDAICFGYCEDCEEVHELHLGASQEYALEVLQKMHEEGRMDYEIFAEEANPKFKLKKLFPGDRGHMFGVMECQNDKGETVWLKAYSSLPGGYRKVPGWVPMILSDQDFKEVVAPQQPKIKQLTRRIDLLDEKSLGRPQLVEERQKISRELQSQLEFLYVFHNQNGEARTMREAWFGNKGIPGGVGECCGPKLLNYAAKKKLKPISVAEFFWGDKNKDGEWLKPRFRICCSARCQPIMGFLLCGTTG